MADAKRGASEPKKSGPTKAQQEMDRFRERQAATGPTEVGPDASASPRFAAAGPFAFVVPPGAAQGWPWPPSVAPMAGPAQAGAAYPGYPGYPGYAAGAYPPGPQAASEGITGRLGSTLGLGVDVVNAVLAGSIGLLQRMGAGYGYAYPAQPYGYGYGYGGGGCGGGCGCGCDPCLTECGGYDCCCTLGCDPCCNPSVGSCC